MCAVIDIDTRGECDWLFVQSCDAYVCCDWPVGSRGECDWSGGETAAVSP